MFKKKTISAFPRLLFLKENMNFGELKKLIYYYARKYIRTPFTDMIIEDENDELKDIVNIEERNRKISRNRKR